jgi:signal transduction histidine kinase
VSPTRPSTLAAPVTAGVVVGVGLAAATGVAWALGTTGGDTVVLVGLAALGSGGAALLGAVVLHRFRHWPLRTQALIVALASLLATVAGVAIAAAAMFLSPHDLGALAVVLVASASISVAAAVQLGEEVGAGARRVAELARGMGDEGPAPSSPQPGSVPEEFAVLADQLSDLDRRLHRSRQRERSLEASRRELVAWVSHDLRSPIATIRAMAEALDDGVADDPATVARYHQQIRGGAERLSALVDDLFELSRITSGALQLERRPVPLGDVVAEAVRAAGAPATTRGVALVERTGDLPRLAVGARELVRVLANLLENAIRHTPPGGTVVVEARSAPGEVALSVLDGCGGIPPTDLARVFDVAFRGDAARGHDRRGGGLGLAIAKGLVEAHQGSIAVANEGKGCRFTVRLPRPDAHDGGGGGDANADADADADAEADAEADAAAEAGAVAPAAPSATR